MDACGYPFTLFLFRIGGGASSPSTPGGESRRFLMKSTTPTFVVELPLRISDQQNRFLEKNFDFGRTLYNATLRTALGRLQHMRESREWRDALAMPNGPERSKCLEQIRLSHGLTEYGLMTIANNHRQASGRTQLGEHEAQNIGKTVWRALEGYMFNNDGKPGCKSDSEGLESIEGSDNLDISYNPQTHAVHWRNQQLPILWKETPWLKAALYEGSDPARPRRVKFCRIVRRSINGRIRWFVQLGVEGVPPKRSSSAPVSEVMGIAPGPNKRANNHPQEAAIKSVAPNVDMKAAEIRRLQRQIARSLRANNPDNYEDDGQVKKDAREWKVSNRCAKLIAKFEKFNRSIAVTHKRDHGTLIIQLLQKAGIIKEGHLETMRARNGD